VADGFDAAETLPAELINRYRPAVPVPRHVRCLVGRPKALGTYGRRPHPGAAAFGLVIGTEFVRAGAHVALPGRDQAALEKAVEEASAVGGASETLSVVCDLASPREITRAAQETMGRLGSVDILVNNAGVDGCFVKLSGQRVNSLSLWGLTTLPWVGAAGARWQ